MADDLYARIVVGYRVGYANTCAQIMFVFLRFGFTHLCYIGTISEFWAFPIFDYVIYERQ